MPSTNEKQKLRGDSPQKRSELEIHITRRTGLFLGLLLAPPYLLLALFGAGWGSPSKRVENRLFAKLTSEESRAISAGKSSQNVILCNPGPWGNLEYVRMSL